jgi:hypothetical protein
MTDPVRWLADKDASPELRELLGRARDVPPLPAGLDRRLAALARQLAATPVAAGAAATAAKSSLAGKTLALIGTSKLAGKLVVGMALLSAASVATYVAVRPSGVSAPTAATRARPGVSAPLARSQRSARSGGTTGDLSAVVANEPSVAARPPKAISSGAFGRAEPAVPPIQVEPSEQDPVGRASFPDPSIAEEARLLERARAALAVDPAGALRITEEHARKHPMAQLGAERELIAIDALMRLGRRDEALGRAAPGLARAPNSLYAKRLRQLLGQPEPE